MEQSPDGQPLQGDQKASTATGVSSSANSVRLWYLVAVERSSALSAADEQRIRAGLVGVRRCCAELIARSPQLVALTAEMVMEAKRDRRAREWFRHAGHKSSLEVIFQLVTEVERLYQEFRGGEPSRGAQAALTDKIERLRISLAGITELASRAVDRRCVGGGLPEDLVALRDQLKQYRNELIDKHLDLVLSELRRMPRFGADKRELLQEGNLGLIRAAELFDERGDVPFVAFSLSWVRAFMRHLIERKRGSVALPDDVSEKLSELRHHAALIDQNTGQAATIQQLSEAAQLEETEVRRLMLLKGLAFEVAPAETTPPPDTQRPTASEGLSALDALVELELIRTVSGALETLNEREARVISERYGFRQATITSRPVIAKNLGVSAERVRQIENAALGKIAKALSDVGVRAEEVGALVFKTSVA
jgi:RNA polymerase sigma factor (sigma-70 family)